MPEVTIGLSVAVLRHYLETRSVSRSVSEKQSYLSGACESSTRQRTHICRTSRPTDTATLD